VPTTMEVILTQAIILIAFVDLGALKYRHANSKFNSFDLKF